MSIIHVSLCKRIEGVCFLTSPLPSYSPPVHMYSISSPLYHLHGSYPKPTTSTPMAWLLPRHRPTRSWRLPSPLIARTWAAPDKPRTHRDRSTGHYGTLHHHVGTHIWEAWYWEAWYCSPLYIICRLT
jgi:hypothetical protein